MDTTSGYTVSVRMERANKLKIITLNSKVLQDLRISFCPRCKTWVYIYNNQHCPVCYDTYLKELEARQESIREVNNKKNAIN